MRRVLILLPLLALAGCKDPQGAVKVTVAYPGFVPGCVRVVARDLASGQDRSTDITDKARLGTRAPLIVAVIVPEDWGSSVEVEAWAVEGSKSCSDAPVVTQKASVTLERGKSVDANIELRANDRDEDGYVEAPQGTDCQDNEAAINPGATERCNDVNDNCDDQDDAAQFQLGQPCMVGTLCTGTFQCDANGGQTCGGLQGALTAYRDQDGDGYGNSADARTLCDNTPPTGYIIGPGTDCIDDNPAVRPGAQERCNSVDDDCDGPVDEGFNVGMACETDQQCSGAFSCNSTGGAFCSSSQTPSSWFRDADGDSYGDRSDSVLSCRQPPERISQGRDCNDGNPLINPDATELCDAFDNDCDDQFDEGAARCPASGPRWVESIVGAADQDWRSITTWTAGGVWAVGDNNRRATLTPPGTTFQVSNSAASGCGSTSGAASTWTAWNTVWADPADNGRAYFASSGGRLARQDTGSANCSQVANTGGLAVFGLVGIPNGGNVDFYGVSGSTTPGEGAAFFWNGASTVTFNPGANDLTYVIDVHGRTRDMVFAVGGYDETTPALTRPNIYRLNPSTTSTWIEQTLPTTPGLNQLKAVWVVSNTVAYAVGNSGTVLRWNGTAWSTLPAPSATDFLSSVIAFDAHSVYVTSNNNGVGRVLRYNGRAWEELHSAQGIRFNDITGTSPEDLWVAGNGGRIYHWPQ